jgi:hypothetical protein
VELYLHSRNVLSLRGAHLRRGTILLLPFVTFVDFAYDLPNFGCGSRACLLSFYSRASWRSWRGAGPLVQAVDATAPCRQDTASQFREQPPATENTNHCAFCHLSICADLAFSSSWKRGSYKENIRKALLCTENDSTIPFISVCLQRVTGKSEGKTPLGRIGVDRRMILKWILGK